MKVLSAVDVKLLLEGNHKIVEELKTGKIKAVNQLIPLAFETHGNNIDVKALKNAILVEFGLEETKKMSATKEMDISKVLFVDSKMPIHKNDKGELCGRPKYRVSDAEWLEDFEIANRKDEFPELHDYIERLIIRT